MPSFFGLGSVVGSYSERLALSSPSLGLLFYQSDTDEYLKYATDVDGVARWMKAELKPLRNLLLNGDMWVWQRGTTINAGGGGASTYAQDRWCFGNNNTSSYNMSRVTNVPNSNFLYSARITANTATVYGLNGWEQYIEQLNMIRARGKYVTLSFWVRGSKAYSNASYYVDCGTTTDQNPGNGNAFTGATGLISGTVNITTSWQKVVAVSSVVVPTTANVMRVGLPKSTFVQNDWIEATGVQLEVGTAPSEFEFVNYSDSLLRCMRYYENASAGQAWPGTAWLEACSNHAQPMNASAVGCQVSFKTPKRTIPNMKNYSYNGTVDAFSFWNDAADRNAGSITYSRTHAGGVGVLNNSANTFSTGNFVWLGWVAIAEL